MLNTKPKAAGAVGASVIALGGLLVSSLPAHAAALGGTIDFSVPFSLSVNSFDFGATPPSPSPGSPSSPGTPNVTGVGTINLGTGKFATATGQSILVTDICGPDPAGCGGPAGSNDVSPIDFLAIPQDKDNPTPAPFLQFTKSNGDPVSFVLKSFTIEDPVSGVGPGGAFTTLTVDFDGHFIHEATGEIFNGIGSGNASILTADFLANPSEGPGDFSVFTGADFDAVASVKIPEPSTVLGSILFGAMAVGGAWKRRQKLSKQS